MAIFEQVLIAVLEYVEYNIYNNTYCIHNPLNTLVPLTSASENNK